MIVLSFVLLAALLLLAAGALYDRLWDRRLSLTLDFSAPEAVEGDTLTLREELVNQKPLPIPMLTARFRLSRNLVFSGEGEAAVSDHYYRSDIFAVNFYQRVVRRLDFVCAKRGYYRVEDMSLAAAGLLNSHALVKPLHSAATLTVLPRPVPFEEMDILYRQVMGDVEVKRFTNPDPFAFRGIREYLPGDDFRHVNFKASAKNGELMVNVYNPTATREIVILLNLDPYAAVCRDSVHEGAIRLAASAAARFIGMGLTVGMVCNGRDVLDGSTLAERAGGGADHLHTLLVRLARISLPAGTDSFEDMMPLPETGRQGGAQPYYLLISANEGGSLPEAYQRLAQAGGASWVVPVYEGGGKDATAAQQRMGIRYWEVVS